jgi:hypothetical protein
MQRLSGAKRCLILIIISLQRGMLGYLAVEAVQAALCLLQLCHCLFLLSRCLLNLCLELLLVHVNRGRCTISCLRGGWGRLRSCTQLRKERVCVLCANTRTFCGAAAALPTTEFLGALIICSFILRVLIETFLGLANDSMRNQVGAFCRWSVPFALLRHQVGRGPLAHCHCNSKQADE